MQIYKSCIFDYYIECKIPSPVEPASAKAWQSSSRKDLRSLFFGSLDFLDFFAGSICSKVDTVFLSVSGGKKRRGSDDVHFEL
jgi:hypothetical protein